MSKLKLPIGRLPAQDNPNGSNAVPDNLTSVLTFPDVAEPITVWRRGLEATQKLLLTTVQQSWSHLTSLGGVCPLQSHRLLRASCEMNGQLSRHTFYLELPKSSLAVLGDKRAKHWP